MLVTQLGSVTSIFPLPMGPIAPEAKRSGGGQGEGFSPYETKVYWNGSNLSYLANFSNLFVDRTASLVGWNQKLKFTELSEGGTL